MSNQVTGVILAGGKGRRMQGADKGLVDMSGKPMITYVIRALAPQVSTVLINANRNLEKYQAFGYPVITDTRQGYHGPLAGMASCMEHAKTGYIITAPCDSPNIPGDYVSRMQGCLAAAHADLCVAAGKGRLQPVFALIRTALLQSLESFLQGDERKIDIWFNSQNMTTCDFSDRPDFFTNINTPDDMQLFVETRQ